MRTESLFVLHSSSPPSRPPPVVWELTEYNPGAKDKRVQTIYIKIIIIIIIIIIIEIHQ